VTVGNLRHAIRAVSPLVPDDSAAKAVRLLRAQSIPALPVAEGSHLVGLVYESDLALLAVGADDPHATAWQTQVRDVMRPISLRIREDQPLSDLAIALSDPALVVIPIAGVDGRYLGLLQRRDALAAFVGEPVPPPIAGLATPFGIRLTTGALRAGAGDLSLSATGAILMLMNLLAGAIVYGLSLLADRAAGVVQGSGVTQLPPTALFVIGLLFGVLQMVIFLVILRLSPLTAVHAAEHMVVHAIEQGEDLTLEKVRALPRVHPRCGTNLMALLILLVIAQQFLSSMGRFMDEATGSLVLVVLVMIVLLTWRRLGAWLQSWVTTRTPSDRQLSHALQAGRALLDKVRAHPDLRTSLPLRIWNAGFLQVIVGFAIVFVAADYGGALLAAAWAHLVR
jgi:CBS domain-containing protein